MRGSGTQIVIGTKFDQPGLAVKKPDGTMAGFDVDVATYVAGQLGYKPDQIEWKEAPSGQRETLIQNGQVDYIVATYSITDARKQKVDFAGPYLITGQSLLVRADNTDITGAESLQNGKRLCSVSGSTPAQRIKDKYPGVQLQQYDTYSACIEALRNGAIDAVSTDEVILAGFAAQFPGAFKIIGKPFSTERYGIGLRKGRQRTAQEDQRRAAEDAARRRLEGRLRPQPRAGRDQRAAAPPLDTGASAGQAENVQIFGKYRAQILRAFWTTIQLTVFAAIGALILGTVLAAMRLSPVPMLNWLGTAYVNVVRNTPLTLIILFCSFGLAQTLGITLVDPKSPTSIADSNFRLAVLGLTVYTASFVCETIRSGVNTIPLGRPRRPGHWADLRPEHANDPVAAGLSRGDRSAGLGTDRADQEHHHRLGDRGGRGGAADEGDDREHRGPAGGRHHLRGRLPDPDPAAGAVVRLARQALGGGAMKNATHFECAVSSDARRWAYQKAHSRGGRAMRAARCCSTSLGRVPWYETG